MGGAAIRSAVAAVAPGQEHGRDVWHILHRCAQTQGRLDRAVATARAQVAAGAAYRARKAAGERVAGFAPGQAAAGRLPEQVRVATSVRYLTEELRRLLGVVVRQGGRVLDAATRAGEVGAVLELLADVAAGAPAGQQEEVGKLGKTLEEARGELLASSRALEPVQVGAEAALGAAALDELAWAWERRVGLGWGVAEIVAGVPAEWREVGTGVLAAWTESGRTSSKAEGWHSVLRPHLAVHRVLDGGLLALLAGWHTHRVAPRGVHAGTSPLQRSGYPQAAGDWLTVLGYPPTGESGAGDAESAGLAQAA